MSNLANLASQVLGMDKTSAGISTACAQVKSDIVTSTLDTLNSRAKNSKNSASSAMSDIYDLNKKVVGAVYLGTGTILQADS